GAPLAASLPYLPELLKRESYRTAAFVGSLVLDPKNGTAPGFDRGFDVYDAGFRIRRPGEDRYQTVERRGDEVVRRAVDWMNDGVGSRRANRAEARLPPPNPPPPRRSSSDPNPAPRRRSEPRPESAAAPPIELRPQSAAALARTP